MTPLTFHVTFVSVTPLSVAAYVAVAPAATEAADGETHNAEHAAIVNVTVCDTVVSACEIAVTVTVGGLGTTAGDV